MDLRPQLPPSAPVDLPGRGRTWVYDSGEGQGAPVLLLHGWTSTAALNWYRCFPALDERYRVVALDQRGHGRGVRSRAPFRLEDCADDAAALIRTLDLGPATVVGYSMGGPVAQLLWRRHPDLVQELVLCATACRFATRRQFTGPVGTVGMGASMALSLLPRGVRRSAMHFATRSWASGGASDWAIEEWRRHDPSALVQAGLALGRFDSTPWIGTVDVPTAVVMTTLDHTVPTRSQQRLADSVPGARVFPVEADHRACVDAPRLFVPALLAACDTVRRAAATSEA